MQIRKNLNTKIHGMKNERSRFYLIFRAVNFVMAAQMVLYNNLSSEAVMLRLEESNCFP